MIRRTMVVLLLLASAGSVVLLSHPAGRGLSYTLYEEPGWAGDVPTLDR